MFHDAFLLSCLNYCPIILELYARENGIITKEQFAYLKNSSTIAALLKVVDEQKWAKYKGLITTAVFLQILTLTEGLRCH